MTIIYEVRVTRIDCWSDVDLKKSTLDDENMIIFCGQTDDYRKPLALIRSHHLILNNEVFYLSFSTFLRLYANRTKRG